MTRGTSTGRRPSSPEFRELIAARRRFVVPATIFFLSWYFGFILLAGYTKDFMASSVYEGLTVGYCLALTQLVMVGVLGLMYLKRAQTVYDPGAARRRPGEPAGPSARVSRASRCPRASASAMSSGSGRSLRATLAPTGEARVRTLDDRTWSPRAMPAAAE